MRTIEYFLSASVAREYSLHFHRFGRIFPELFSSAPSLHKHYSNELIEIERFRSDLAASLSQNPDEVRRVAERWALFLKTRASAMESWSSLATALLAISGILPLVGPRPPIQTLRRLTFDMSGSHRQGA